MTRGITPYKDGYRVRVKRGTVWYNGGVWQDLAQAETALASLLQDVPARKPSRAPVEFKPAKRFRERNIYVRKQGYQVRLTREGRHIYGGTFRDLVEARCERDRLEVKHPLTKQTQHL